MNIFKKISHWKHIIMTMSDNVKQIRFNQKRYILEQNLLKNDVSGISNERYCNHDIIVSLTTYGRRIHDVYLPIESIMCQTMKANRIILWLDYSFRDRPLPRSLQMQQKRGLEIHFCKDIKSYTKLIPSLKKYPNDVIITIDDDHIYEFDMLENLITAYLHNMAYIYCCRYHYMVLNRHGKLTPYNKWKQRYDVTNKEDIMNFPNGCGGILYPPHSLDDEVFNESVFMDICRYADDVWFKAMALKKGTLSMKVPTHEVDGNDALENNYVQDTGLKKINTEGTCMNDRQIDAVFNRYDLFKLLK